MQHYVTELITTQLIPEQNVVFSQVIHKVVPATMHTLVSAHQKKREKSFDITYY